MRFYRCRWDKKIGGVCGGIGHACKVDPTIIRLSTIFLCVITGILPVFLIYLLLWIVMPLGPRAYVKIPCKKLYRSRVDRKIGGICGGLGIFLGIDSTIIRITMIILMVLTGFFPILISYIVGMIVIPEQP